MLSSEEILEKTKKVLEDEGYEFGEEKTNLEVLSEFILPGLKNSKDTLGSIYSLQTRPRGGILGKIKNKIQMKIVNTCINVIEKQSMKQQKFNELTYRAIERLIEENKELREKLNS